MTQDDIYLSKCERSCRALISMRDLLHMKELVVYGSLARGLLGMTSDIDLLVVSDCSSSEVVEIRKKFQWNMPEFMDGEFPYVDIKIAKASSFYYPDNSEYGDYMRRCREEGVSVWTRA